MDRREVKITALFQEHTKILSFTSKILFLKPLNLIPHQRERKSLPYTTSLFSIYRAAT